jgi:hypothetical protein
MNNQQGQGLAPSVIDTVNRYTDKNALDLRNELEKKQDLIKKNIEKNKIDDLFNTSA